MTGQRPDPERQESAAAPLVTVVIPAFNAARTLAATLRSALQQTHRNLEVLVVDDGSEDETRALAASLAAADPRIRVLTQSNQGVARARNLGLREARADYVAFLDADDLWHPDKLERQLQVLRSAGANTAFVYCWYRTIDAHDQVVGSAPTFRLCDNVLCRHVLINFVGNGSGMLARKSAVLACGGFDASLRDQGLEGVEDFLLQLRMASRYDVQHVPEYLVGYRRTRSSMSANAERMAWSRMKVLETVQAECPQVPAHAFRWGAGPYLMARAANVARQGRVLPALRLLGLSVRLDALGACVEMSSILLEQLRSYQQHLPPALRVGPLSPRPAPRPFHSYAPTESLIERQGWLRELRLKRLEAYDTALRTSLPLA